MNCSVCGFVDEHYDENSAVHHNDTPKHQCNLILFNYKENKKSLSKNKDGMIILGNATTDPLGDANVMNVQNTDCSKIRIYVKPNQRGIFRFDITNDMNIEDVLVIGIQLAHPQPQFVMNEHPYQFGQKPYILKKQSSIKDKISVVFHSVDIGHYEMPIMFTFFRMADEKNIIVIREMVVMVQEHDSEYMSNESPYTNKDWEKVDHCIPSTIHVPHQTQYKVPNHLKILFLCRLEEKALEDLEVSKEILDKLRFGLVSTRAIFDEGLTKSNYMKYFHHLLWWEEFIARINIRKYNMASVPLEQDERSLLEVPESLAEKSPAEKRPSLLRGDLDYIRPQESPNVMFETTIKEFEDNYIKLANVDEIFWTQYGPEDCFDVRCLMSRVRLECLHEAVSRVFELSQDCRVFPVAPAMNISLNLIDKFYNPLIAKSEEQKSAVEHIVSGTSGKAPYIVFGPPGTGKTMTIVEAIIQIVVRNNGNRVMVCTESNMAADHIALMLLQYKKQLNIPNFLMRANSQTRKWSVMPPALAPVSNGTSYDTFHSVSNVQASGYRIFVTTLLHAAKYGALRSQAQHKLQMSHLFIDEAGQASEPAALVPVCGLLAPAGQLVLAGDPQQLGPVCISRDAKDRGLGQSLLERLKKTYDDLYNDSNFITMLVKNFRSDPDILMIPNELFYDNCLQACATPDPLSRTSVLGAGGERALVFHAVHSREQRMGNAPSYFNEKELDMLQRYTKALIEKHNVSPKDIGIIAPYTTQVYKMKGWLTSENYKEIEVGTVESFQGKEKRVILVSMVRANCRLLDYDAKYSLGFVIDDKRYNVILTRAKAKLIIIGNPSCLTRDLKWRKYMSLCKDYDSYYGKETEQMERDSRLLTEIAITRFQKCRLSDYFNPPKEQQEKKLY